MGIERISKEIQVSNMLPQNFIRGRWYQQNNSTMQNTLLYDVAAEGAAVNLSEEYMDLRQIMDQEVAPSQSNGTGDFIEDFFDNGLGTNPDNENETSLCQSESNEDPNDLYMYSDAVTSPLDGEVMYEHPPMLMMRQASVMVAEQVLGRHDSGLSNEVLLQGLGQSVESADNEALSPESLAPHLGQFSPLDPQLFQDVEKGADNEEDNTLSRMRYHSMNEADYVFEQSPLPNVARQRSMSENHASAIFYQLGSSPNGDSTNNSDNQTTTAEEATTSYTTTTTVTTVNSSTLDDSFLNGESQDTQSLINNYLFTGQQTDNTELTKYSAEVALVPIPTISEVQENSRASTSGIARKRTQSKNIDDRRNKNNAACRESRKRRKDKKDENERLVHQLDVENDELRAKISKLEVAVKDVKARVLRAVTAGK